MANGYRERACPDCGALTAFAPQINRWMNADGGDAHFCVPKRDVTPGHGPDCVCETCWARTFGERQEVAQPARNDQAILARLDRLERELSRLAALVSGIARDVRALKGQPQPNGEGTQASGPNGPQIIDLD